MAHIIVVGNEKGGAGKSTVSMHVATALARMGHRVGALDLDLRQKTFGRYSANRAKHLETLGFDLPGPTYLDLPEIDQSSLKPGENIYDHRLSAAVAQLEADNDFILIDCPGSHTRLDGDKIMGPSVYSEMVWNARQLRAQAGLQPIDWIVLRNRLGAQNMVNKKKMESALDRLAKRIGFRVAPGFHERVIFRELFPRGLTLLDLKDVGVKQLNISNVAARQELRDLIKSLNLPGVELNF
ncbi:Sporulation initiation inhibitor protein Soj [Nymphon striatum]|nr:Sporulation initiation inhibitor protein Soj [Nymphon striatum]